MRDSHMPSPIILCHITQSRIHTSLSGDGMRSGGEKFRDTCGFQTGLSWKSGQLSVLLGDHILETPWVDVVRQEV